MLINKSKGKFFKGYTTQAVKPQPTEDEVVTMRRHSAVSVASEEFQRIIVHCTTDDNLSQYAVVMWEGEQPEVMPHSNSRKTDRPFYRTGTN